MSYRFSNISTQLNDAFLRHLPVSVYQDGELIGFGPIERHTKYTIVIFGEHFFKHTCEFKIKS